MINVGIIGCGHWGPNHIRIFTQLPESQALMCADLSQDKLDNIKNLYPRTAVTTDYKEILANKDIEAVCVSTPTNTHYQVTKEALESGKHVLCEKPLAMTVAECEELKALALKNKKVLIVGHVFLFNAGILKLKECIQSGELGPIHYAYASRTNLGPFRYDVNALWDLAPHDISIFNYLFESAPMAVSARGQKSLDTSLEDLAFVTLEYPNKIMVNIHVSWLDPKKVRQITLVGDKKMIAWDDLDSVGPIKVYDKYVEKTSTSYESYGEFQLLSKEGSITIPKISLGEPLKAQARFFLQCVRGEDAGELSDAQKGLDVVKVLCAAQASIEQQGARVQIN